MSVSGVGSSPVLQWLQNYLSSAGSVTGSQSSCGRQPSSDTTSISQQAVQLNASQASQTTDPSQTSGVNGSQGHHHHHHHHGEGQGGGQGGGPLMDKLAQAIVTDLQKATGSGASAGSTSSSADSTGSSPTSDSFLDKLASAIATDLLAKYQQATGSSTTPSPTSTTNQVNVTA